MTTRKSRRNGRSVETIIHEEAARKYIPTAEYQSLLQVEVESPIRVAYQRRNRDLDPQLVWRGKDEQDWSDLVVHAAPLYIQEKVHPKVLIDDLMRQSRSSEKAEEYQLNLFADFNGLPEGADRTGFYQHDANWSNRMILGDSLQVMASLAEREGLRGRVQCIYIDPPYGIRFNSNFQWSTTSRDVKDGNRDHITREPEQVKAFRDTWRDEIHSYLTYLRDRLVVARDLLTETGSIFVQIGDENIHLVRSLMDEVFGSENFISNILFSKTTGFSGAYLSNVADYLIWYAKAKDKLKYRQLFREKVAGGEGASAYRPLQSIGMRNADRVRATYDGTRPARLDQLTSQGASAVPSPPIELDGATFSPAQGLHWETRPEGIARLHRADRVAIIGTFPAYIRFVDDFPAFAISNLWEDTGTGGFTEPKIYGVQTNTKVIERCVLMTTDPGDLVLDPTCGSGTTAYAAEQWGRRWITIDTSRVALALARARVMGARYPYYLLADSRDGQLKEAEVSRTIPSDAPTYGNIRQGFVYERVSHVQLSDIAHNSEIDVIWEKYKETLDPLRRHLNQSLGRQWEEWEISRDADTEWPDEAKKVHTQWWEQRMARQREIDASIVAKADFEYLYDRPYEDRSKVRVAGPFTVESLSPHRVLGVGEDDELID